MLTELNKISIQNLRLKGKGYKLIAKELGISLDLVKGYSNKLGLNNEFKEKIKSTGKCLECNKDLLITKGKKPKKYCSLYCKNKWKRTHPQYSIHGVDKIFERTCPTCHKKFISLYKTNTKYCSHTCYIIARFPNSKTAKKRSNSLY